MYFLNIFKKFFQNTQQKNIVIVSLALNLERGGGGRGRKKNGINVFFFKGNRCAYLFGQNRYMFLFLRNR